MTDMLEGIFTALATPFRDGGVDWDALSAHVERQLAAGVHGLVPCGTTGESPTLSPEEHGEVVAFVVEKSGGQVPVVAGTGSNSTVEALEYTRHAKEVGADAGLVVLPYYNKPTPRGIIQHFQELSQVGLPLVIYNIPGRCGIGLDLETYKELERIPQVVATKEASGDLDLIEDVLMETSLTVLSGDDRLTFPILALGGRGVISVASNLVPRAMVDMYDLILEQELERARDLHRSLVPLMKALFIESNPAPLKAALASLGQMEEIVRSPLMTVLPETRMRLEAALSAALETK